MDRTLPLADIAHYDPSLAELSMGPASHGRSSRPCTRARERQRPALGPAAEHPVPGHPVQAPPCSAGWLG
jgi:hypothetical protein